MVVYHVDADKKKDPKKGSGAFYDDMDAAKKHRGCALFSCGGCLGFIALLILAMLLGVASVAAATGAYQIPVLSSLFYHGDPAPLRTVEPAKIAGFENLLTPSSKAGIVILSESQLTTILQQPNRSGQLVLKHGQIAINPTGAELYGQVIPPMIGRPVIVRAYITPDGTGQIQLTKLEVGYVTVPLQLARSIIQLATGQNFSTTASLKRFGITSATLNQGSATVKIDPAKLESAASSTAQSAASIIEQNVPNAIPGTAH